MFRYQDVCRVYWRNLLSTGRFRTRQKSNRIWDSREIESKLTPNWYSVPTSNMTSLPNGDWEIYCQKLQAEYPQAVPQGQKYVNE